MGAVPRACIDCGCLVATGEDRCAQHAKERRAARTAHRRKAPGDGAQARARARARRGGLRCAACDAGNVRLEADHVVPLWDGGTDYDSNVQLLCYRCHKAKTGREASHRGGTLAYYVAGPPAEID